MHFSIPETVAQPDEKGGAYTGYRLHINGVRFPKISKNVDDVVLDFFSSSQSMVCHGFDDCLTT